MAEISNTTVADACLGTPAPGTPGRLVQDAAAVSIAIADRKEKDRKAAKPAAKGKVRPFQFS